MAKCEPLRFLNSLQIFLFGSVMSLTILMDVIEVNLAMTWLRLTPG